ncbi:hypothetical protein [Flagellimonas nanhaiensis]|uniref:Uncharacterized protein n=1 Tax=Flagellimonas nanhaiensis TaxID=2292706 RepID=A0A371JRA8_9FLAO|nr:hypothetical protein [Allomuricauda nanhaiensis]RDY60035.1 hypothetical protein DX873_11890 [Allomuricauda nanhaiensis]
MIQYLVAQVEEQLGWGSGTNWSNKDFEELSDRIFESTKKRLSVTTLKRIWGRAELIANPSSATLDILSEFIGHRNWREFKGSYRSQPLKNAIQKRLKVPHLTVFLLLVLVSVALFTIFWDKDSVITKTTAIISETDFKFRSRTVSNEIPNSVVFEYDASTASDSAVIEIQQDWDKRKRIAIERTDSIATCIYYLPGFFKSKLVVDGVIVKEEDVFIKTQDWLGVIHRDTSPIYLKNEEIKKNGQLSIAPEVLAAYNIDPRTSNVKVGLYQVRDFGEISTNDFELSMQLKNTLQDGLSGCQEAKVFILYDGGAFGIPLSKKGCVSNLNLLIFDQYIDGKKNDLSGFGVDFEDFAELQCISRDNKFEILVNGVQVYEGEAPETPLKIKGVSIQFEGSGTIGNMELKNSSESFYLNHKGER